MMISKSANAYLGVAATIAALVPAILVSLDAPVGAATAACRSACTSLTAKSLGTGEVLAVSGSSVTMSAASRAGSTADFTAVQEGDVANAVSAGVLSAKLDMLYSTDQLVEYEYAPNGVPSGNCLANTWTNNPTQLQPYNVPTTTVVLARCGLTAQSLWILDATNASSGYVDLINAGYEATFGYLAPTANNANTLTSPFAEPEVLMVSGSTVELAELSEIGGVVSPTQMWTGWSAGRNQSRPKETPPITGVPAPALCHSWGSLCAARRGRAVNMGRSS